MNTLLVPISTDIEEPQEVTLNIIDETPVEVLDQKVVVLIFIFSLIQIILLGF